MNKATTDLNKDFDIIRKENFKLYTFIARKLLTVKFPAGYFRANKQLKRKYFK